MPRMIKLPDTNEDLEDKAVQFEFKGEVLTSTNGLALKSLRLVSQSIDLLADAEEGASADDESSLVETQAFDLQYELMISLLSVPSRAIFENLVDTAEPPVQVEDMMVISQTLIEELLGGNQPASSGGLSDTTTPTEDTSTAQSTPQAATLLTTSDLL